MFSAQNQNRKSLCDSIHVSTSQGHLIAGVKGNSCALLGLHRAPWALWIPKAHKRGD